MSNLNNILIHLGGKEKKNYIFSKKYISCNQYKHFNFAYNKSTFIELTSFKKLPNVGIYMHFVSCKEVDF